MSTTLDFTEFDTEGAALALPRSNGELIFDAPWQGRLFGLVVHLCKAGAFEWDEFKTHLPALMIVVVGIAVSPCFGIRG